MHQTKKGGAKPAGKKQKRNSNITENETADEDIYSTLSDDEISDCSNRTSYRAANLMRNGSDSLNQLRNRQMDFLRQTSFGLRPIHPSTKLHGDFL